MAEEDPKAGGDGRAGGGALLGPARDTRLDQAYTAHGHGPFDGEQDVFTVERVPGVDPHRLGAGCSDTLTPATEQ